MAGGNGKIAGRRAQSRSGGGGALGVVVVGDGGAKGGVEVAALVAGGELDQRAFVAGEDALHPADVAVEFVASLLVSVVIDAVEAQKESHGRAQLGEEAGVAVAEAGAESGEGAKFEKTNGQWLTVNR